MKKVSLILAALALVLGISQCKKQEEPVASGEKQHIVLNASFGGGNSKIADNSTGGLKWTVGDVINVSQNGQSLSVEGLKCTNAENGTFEGEITETTGNITFKFGSDINYLHQTGELNKAISLTAEAPYDKDGNYSVTMNMMDRAVVKLDLSKILTVVGQEVNFSAQNGLGVTLFIEREDFESPFYVAIPAPNKIVKVDNIAVDWNLEPNFFYTAAGEGGAPTGDAIVIEPATPAPTIPAGALPGLFTVNESGKQVYFSKGNLWADGSNTLHFEDSQWESTPTSDDDMDASHVSHFTWSATVEAAVGTGNEGNYLFCNESHKVSVNESDAIYYALSIDEWEYLFNNHSKKWVTVHGVNGYVIAPDGFAGTLADSYADDAALAADNLVFLPAAGSRFNSISVTGVGSYGHYWSSYRASRYTHYLFFSNDGVESSYDYNRYIGMSLRLVSEK